MNERGKLEVGSGWRVGLAVGAALLLASGGLSAQETIASDRPGFASGSTVIGKGLLQLEMGAQYAGGGVAGVYSFGQGLLRYGLAEGLELQALLNSVTFLRAPNHDREGFSDMGVGMKVRLPVASEEFSLSLLSTVLFPTGSRHFTSDETIPAVVLLADVPLSDRAGFTGNLGYSAFLADADDQFSLILTPSVSIPSEVPMSVYGGYAGFYSDSGNAHFAEGGITWLPSSDLQFDLNGGVELDSGDYFIGVGVAARWGSR